MKVKKGDIVLYNNLTFQRSYHGVVVGRNEEDTGYEVVRLNDENKPFILLIGGVDFDTAFDQNIVEVYVDGKDLNDEKIF